MGFKEDSIAFKKSLPHLGDFAISDSDFIQAKDLLEEAITLKKMLDPMVEHSPAHRYKEVKRALAELAAGLRTPGFQHDNVAFASIERVAKITGEKYIVNSIEELPE